MDAETRLRERGFCVLRSHFSVEAIEACRNAFWPVLLDYLNRRGQEPNRGPFRHFLPMPFEHPCFSPEFFFDGAVLSVVSKVLGNHLVADQWGCDAPVKGSEYQGLHVDFQRPLFAEAPDLILPAYMLVVSFGLKRITGADGPIEIAPGTHRMRREDAVRAVGSGEIELEPVSLEIGDVLIRHPWALHRGTPNTTDTPRALVTIRYVSRWYADGSREVNRIPEPVWQSFSPEQREFMRFPVEMQVFRSD